MTIEEAIQDLKQYIDVSLNQRMVGLATKDDLKAFVTKEDLKALEQRIEQRMASKEDLFESQLAIAETLTTAIDALASKDRVDDHERRITRLEHRSA